MSVDRVAYIADYAAAKAYYESTTHIRGQSEHRKPLGDRRYHSAFYMCVRHEDVGPVYECFLYRTPVVKFMPDGTVELRNGGWASNSTHRFITKLTDVRTSKHEGETVAEVSNGSFQMERGLKLVLRRNEQRQYEVIEGGATQTKYSINRKGTANIRKRYAEFLKYFEGMVALRREGPDTKNPFLKANRSEFAGVTMAGGFDETFISLISATGDDQHEKFYKAFLLVVLTSHVQLKASSSETIVVLVRNMREGILETMYRQHSNESLTKTDIPLGGLGSRKYKDWCKEGS